MSDAQLKTNASTAPTTSSYMLALATASAPQAQLPTRLTSSANPATIPAEPAPTILLAAPVVNPEKDTSKSPKAVKAVSSNAQKVPTPRTMSAKFVTSSVLNALVPPTTVSPAPLADSSTTVLVGTTALVLPSTTPASTLAQWDSIDSPVKSARNVRMSAKLAITTKPALLATTISSLEMVLALLTVEPDSTPSEDSVSLVTAPANLAKTSLLNVLSAPLDLSEMELDVCLAAQMDLSSIQSLGPVNHAPAPVRPAHLPTYAHLAPTPASSPSTDNVLLVSTHAKPVQLIYPPVSPV